MTEGLLAGLGGAILFACSASSNDTTSTNSGSDGGTDGATGTDGAISSGDWASGGTAAMTAKASYPDPFATPAMQCILLASATEGPCTEAEDRVREDISEGYPGLPMRIVFRVVDTNCNPIANAKVKIWHTQLAGSYSGNTPNDDMCLTSAAESSKHYFRGVQTTDEDGRVAFDSCFPGWYRGRTPHVHYTVTTNGKSFTSQVVFEQTLVQDIFATHPDYEQYGQPDTDNADDNVVGIAKLSSYIVTAAKMSDGALLASKELVVFTA